MEIKVTPFGQTQGQTEPVEVTTGGTYDAGSSTGITTDQNRKMYEWAVADGLMSREAADSELAGQGLPALPPFHAKNSPEANYDRDFNPANPNQYAMPKVEPDADSGLAETNRLFYRNWLAAGGFPENIGNSLVEIMNKESKAIDLMKDESDKAVWRSRQKSDLQRVWGSNFDENLASAENLLNSIEAKQPGVGQFLRNSGLAHSASVIMILHQQAERVSFRNGKG